MYTVYDHTFGDFPDKNTVYAPYIYGSGQPYRCEGRRRTAVTTHSFKIPRQGHMCQHNMRHSLSRPHKHTNTCTHTHTHTHAHIHTRTHTSWSNSAAAHFCCRLLRWSCKQRMTRADPYRGGNGLSKSVCNKCNCTKNLLVLCSSSGLCPLHLTGNMLIGAQFSTTHREMTQTHWLHVAAQGGTVIFAGGGEHLIKQDVAACTRHAAVHLHTGTGTCRMTRDA